MKRTSLQIIAFVIFTLCLLCSCNETETSGNGDLDGYWKLTAVDTLANGGTQDLMQSQRFWAVQHKLITIAGYAFRFEKTDQTLTLFDGYQYSGADSIHPGIDQIERLYPYGIHQQPETFNIDKLTKNHMTLSNSDYRLNFKKF